MSVTESPLQRPPERPFALQKYLILHLQHDALQKRLQRISSVPSATSTAPRSSSPSASPSPSPSLIHPFAPHVRSHRRSGTSAYLPTPLAPISEAPAASAPPSSPSLRPDPPKRRSSYPVTVDLIARDEAMVEDEMKLLDVNQQIKLTLTELLNCDSVRGDRQYRMWVQTRLMEAERELKGRRRCGRRRSVDVQVGRFE